MSLSTKPDDIKSTVSEISPKLVGYYSVDEDGTLLDDASQLRYIRNIDSSRNSLPFNLDYNYVKQSEIDTSRHQMDLLIKYLKFHKEVLNVCDKSEVALNDVPVVTIKKTISEIAMIPFYPYRREIPLYISAKLFNGVLYINLEKECFRNDRPSAWGVKFQQYMLTSEPNGNVDVEKPAYGVESFRHVIKTELGKHILFISGQADGFICQEDEKEPLDTSNMTTEELLKTLKNKEFVDFHTGKENDSARSDMILRKNQYLKWWTHAYIMGFKKVYIGCKDKNGFCTAINEFDTDTLAESGAEFWDYKKCLSFTDNFLTYIKGCLLKEITTQFPYMSPDVDVRDVPEIKLVFETRGKFSIVISDCEHKKNDHFEDSKHLVG